MHKIDTPKSISNIGKSWKDLFAYPFFALTRQQLKTENNKLNIYTISYEINYWNDMTFFSQARVQLVTWYTTINLLPVIQPPICYLWYNHQFVTCDTTINLLPVIQLSICYLWYNHQFVTYDTTINLLPEIQPSICCCRCV